MYGIRVENSLEFLVLRKKANSVEVRTSARSEGSGRQRMLFVISLEKECLEAVNMRRVARLYILMGGFTFKVPRSISKRG